MNLGSVPMSGTMCSVDGSSTGMMDPRSDREMVGKPPKWGMCRTAFGVIDVSVPGSTTRLDGAAWCAVPRSARDISSLRMQAMEGALVTTVVAGCTRVRLCAGKRAERDAANRGREQRNNGRRAGVDAVAIGGRGARTDNGRMLGSDDVEGPEEVGRELLVRARAADTA